jgi:hypothetical protein
MASHGGRSQIAGRPQSAGLYRDIPGHGRSSIRRTCSFIDAQRALANRVAKTIHVSNKFGEIDVWAQSFNLSVKDAWIVVRDFDHDLAFEGWVNAFAEAYDVNELLLREVKVYQSSTSRFLYEVDSVYLTRPKDRLTIEFRR